MKVSSELLRDRLIHLSGMTLSDLLRIKNVASSEFLVGVGKLLGYYQVVQCLDAIEYGELPFSDVDEEV